MYMVQREINRRRHAGPGGRGFLRLDRGLTCITWPHMAIARLRHPVARGVLPKERSGMLCACLRRDGEWTCRSN
jgi:hypothetical protein